MPLRSLLLLILGMTLFGCRQNNHSEPTPSADSVYQQTIDSLVTGYLNLHPQFAVSLGFHQYDGILADYSKNALDRELAWLNDYNQKLDKHGLPLP